MRRQLSENENSQSTHVRNRKTNWLWILPLIGVLAIGAYFRFIGLDWDENHHLHPDERFLTMVASAISPVQDINEYFDTESSSLNPHNRGFHFYVYGTLPLFTVRYIAEWVGKIGYGEVYLVGRIVSGFMDLFTILLVYLVAQRLYKNRKLSLLAAAFSASAVLQIQLSHYFTVDIFANFFSFLTLYFAVHIMTKADGVEAETENGSVSEPDEISDAWKHMLQSWEIVVPYILFGIAFGMAVASKISTVPLALLLPTAVFIRYRYLSSREKDQQWIIFLRNMAIAAVVSMIVFRIFQPYAFSGPTFFGLKPNEKWVSNMSELSRQSGGNVDFPPALQWARRPVWFALDNLVEWGLGLPLGALSFIGFLWMLWRIIKGDWKKNGLIWIWTAVYFIWQSLNFTSSMRYLLSIYPTLTVIASWVIFAVGERKNTSGGSKIKWSKVISGVIGLAVLVSSLAWAFAFTRIYSRPVTRVEASRWIYQNVPGPINLRIESGEEIVNQPIAFPLGHIVTQSNPIVIAFESRYEGSLAELNFSHIVNKGGNQQDISLSVMISDDYTAPDALAKGVIQGDFHAEQDPRGLSYILHLDHGLYVKPGEKYYLIIDVLEANAGLDFYGPITMGIATLGGVFQQALPQPVQTISMEDEYITRVDPIQDGTLREVFIPHIVDWGAQPFEKTLQLTITDPSKNDVVVTSAILQDSFLPDSDPRGKEYTFDLYPPLMLDSEKTYKLHLSVLEGIGELAVYGSKQADESTWDDKLPIGLDGYNPFDYYNGVYRTDLNFEMYWDDNVEKRERFYTILDQADYIYISSNRQWGTTVRVPERYPLTTEYYRNLLGCPDDKKIIWCYSVAVPAMFEGGLGFDLIKISQSDPNLGPIKFNSQFAEEAFTVYDHPKVLIFQKTERYQPSLVRDVLGAVDLSQVIHLTPGEASNYSGNLTLPLERLTQQRKGGTWADLFDRENLLNDKPFIGLFLWYLTICILGWVMYPVTRIAFLGLSRKGYPLARLLGLIILAWIVWIAGSAGVPFTKLTISIVMLLLLGGNLTLFLVHREAILRELREHWKYYLFVELFLLAVFSIGVLIRLGNPDLWHPSKGGEKPMDFSYLNAVLKSTTFPPYDPWYAGGYINYYYYGFVLVGVLVKWLGIIPSIAYNFILPTLLMLLAAGTFTVGWNLADAAISIRKRSDSLSYNLNASMSNRVKALAGMTSTILMIFLGNLGTTRMIWHGLMKLASPDGIEGSNLFQRVTWTIQGISKFISGSTLPYGPGDWYWIPSRAIPNEPITEFPFFTFLYADLHAHLIALPITVLVICWVISIIRGKWQWNKLSGRLSILSPIITIFAGALIIGALKPTNTWDYPTYLTLGSIALFYVCLRYADVGGAELSSKLRPWKKIILACASVGVLVGLSMILYQPFTKWYGQAYGTIKIWDGDHTPFWSYFTHWGLFLFLIFSWMFWETRDWMANTPVSALNKLRPYRGVIQGVLILLLVAIIGLLIWGVNIAWLVLPMAVWSATLIIRPGQSDLKRAVLFFTGTALILSLTVELIVLEGDIGRMNTVFKFYLQAWTFFSISAASMFVWVFAAVISKWSTFWRNSWQVFFIFLISSAALFPIMGGLGKIQDRMSSEAPHTLDGMTFMAYSKYHDNGVEMELREDYEAILWMQDNIQGSPVIVEANTPEYRWGSRFTIYTGLPGVVGWNWHQRQQRAVTSSTWVWDRVDAIEDFYNSSDKGFARSFLRKYDVDYIVVGQLEYANYQARGLDKFFEWEGDLWTKVYNQGQTIIYQVIR